jgi:hypothetical protein
MGFAERLAELKNHSKPRRAARQNRQNPVSVSFVTPPTGPTENFSVTLDADGYPAALCQICGGGNYHLATQWRCSRCRPSAESPRRTPTIARETIAQGDLQDVERVLRRAVAGTPISAEALRSALDHADLDDVRHGRITVRNLRAFTATLDSKPVRSAEPVRCIRCVHFRRRTYHPHLGGCAAGVPPDGAAGLWDTDRRLCTLFSRADSEPTRPGNAALSC